MLYNATTSSSSIASQRSQLQAPHPQPAGQFGRALAVLDFNLDGVDDLAVSSPGASDWDLSSASANPFPTNQTPSSFRSWGKVYILLGKSGAGLDASRSITLETTKDWVTLGEVSLAADINGDGHADLLLGCPSATSAVTGATHGGRVFGVLSSAANVASPHGRDIEDAAALDLSGNSRFEMLGQSMAMVGTNTLLVGAPFSRINNVTTGQPTIATGRVYGFTLAVAGASTVSANITFEITTPPSDALGEFGFAMASSPAAVAIAAPSVGTADSPEPRHGVVLLANPSTITSLRGNLTVAQVPWSARLSGSKEYARFGHAIGFADVDRDSHDELIVAAPMHTQSWVNFAQRELGAVYAWNASTRGNASAESAAWHVTGTRPRGRFGSAFAFVPALGLTVASPRAPSTANSEMVGAVDVVTKQNKLMG